MSAAEQPYAVLAAPAVLSLTRHGELAEAEEQLGRALDLLRIDGMLVQRAWALLLVGSVRHARGDGQCPPARPDPSGVTIASTRSSRMGWVASPGEDEIGL